MVINLPLFNTNKNKETILVLDPSASHMAWAMADLDFERNECAIFYASQIWTASTWERGRRFRYMQQCINFLVNGIKDAVPTIVVTEQFFANPKQLMGSAVVPTINSFLEIAADVKGVKYFEIGASTWRSILGIKAIKDAKGKRDYKKPTLDYVETALGKLPETIKSNIDFKERKTPNDISDCLAITLAVAKHHGLAKAQLYGATFYPKSHLDEFSKLANQLKELYVKKSTK